MLLQTFKNYSNLWVIYIYKSVCMSYLSPVKSFQLISLGLLDGCFLFFPLCGATVSLYSK